MGVIPHMTPNPDGKFGIDDMAVFTMAWNGRCGTQDLIADLAPCEGSSVPNIWSNPDGKLDVQDLLVFTAMFDWFNANVHTFSLPHPSQPAPPPGDGTIASINCNKYIQTVTREEGGLTILDIFADNLMSLTAAELDIAFNSGDYTVESCRQGGFLTGDIFRTYACETGLRIFLSDLTNKNGVSGSGKLAEVVFIRTDKASYLTVGYDLRNADGAVIEKGSVGAAATILPKEFSLNAACPNPFNNMTKLTFDMPEAGFVNLSIFDLRGRLVASLVNSEVAAGCHAVVWNAADAAAGLYLARLEAPGFTGIRKFILVK